jgi:hypothetical protein
VAIAVALWTGAVRSVTESLPLHKYDFAKIERFRRGCGRQCASYLVSGAPNGTLTPPLTVKMSARFKSS